MKNGGIMRQDGRGGVTRDAQGKKKRKGPLASSWGEAWWGAAWLRGSRAVVQ